MDALSGMIVTMNKGGCKDFAEYRFYVGQNRGLEQASILLDDVCKKYLAED